MKAILTSSLGGASKVNGVRVPSILIQRNGLLDNLRAIWPNNAKVLIICAGWIVATLVTVARYLQGGWRKKSIVK